MSKRIAASSTSASTFTSSVQKGKEFEKKVLEKLRFLPNLHCSQVK